MSSSSLPIGEQIKRLRESRGWSQKALSDRAQVDASLVSRIEAGEYPNPRNKTVNRLEAAFGLAEGSLRSVSKAIGHRGNGEVRILLPHSIIAAPFFRLAKEGEVPKVSFSSFRRSDATQDIVWLPNADRSLPDSAARNIRPFMSPIIREMLDKGEADAIFAWNGIVDDYEGIYRKYAQVAFGLTTLNCVRILPGDPAASIEESPFPVIYPLGLDNIVRRYKPRLPFVDRVAVDFSNWEVLEEHIRDALRIHGRLALFVSEPYLSWIKKTLERDSYQFRFETPLGMDLENREEAPVFSTMDIVIRADDAATLQWLSEERRKTGGFFGRLKASIRSIREGIRNPDILEPIPTIATFLQMNEEELKWRLRRFEFDVRFYD